MALVYNYYKHHINKFQTIIHYTTQKIIQIQMQGNNKLISKNNHNIQKLLLVEKADDVRNCRP